MACNICDELTRGINREPPGSDFRKQYEYKLIWHLAFKGIKTCHEEHDIWPIVYDRQ